MNKLLLSESNKINGNTILITGGTGTFGQYFTNHLLKNYKPRKILILSRDEYKQWQMKNNFKKHEDNLRFLIGDIRDKNRLNIAFRDVDYIIHAAAMKQIDTVEYNPFEAIETNINGSKNVIECAIENNVKKVVALNTDKSCAPINFYGGTKFLMEKLFQISFVYSKNQNIKLSIVRYGNIANSRGSVIQLFRKMINEGCKKLPITDEKMTRFWTDIDDAVNLVIESLNNGVGGDIFIPKCKSFRILDLIKALDMKHEIIGKREGEKLSEQLILNHEDCFDYGKFFKIYPYYYFYDKNLKMSEYKENTGLKYNKLDNFCYDSSLNNDFLSVSELKERLKYI